MSQIAMPAAGYAYASPVNCTHAELASIVANASFLWERLAPECSTFVVDNAQANVEIDRRLNRWCQVAAQGNWDTLQKRIQWEGLDFDSVLPRLGTVRLTATEPLPEWAETLRQIIQTAAEFTPESVGKTDSENPIPFEDVLLRAIAVARKQLLTRLGYSTTHSRHPAPITALRGCLSSLRTEFAAPTGSTLHQDIGL